MAELDDTAHFYRTLRRSLWGLPACAAAVALCFFFVDRPAAFFVRNHKIDHIAAVRWLGETPMLLNAASALLIVAACVRRAGGPLTRQERTLLAASVSLVVAVALEWYIKGLFGRLWPATWINDNPSLLGTGDYGFLPFRFDQRFGSFPSGHTARAFSWLAVVWIAYPRLLAPGLLICASVVAGLVGMNYHFVGDCVGGAYLGVTTAAFTAAFFGLGGASD